ncbi:MAG: hypothetical protein PF694_12010 [Bacteroidetes bacterium]|jgi:hypothetical protein|nr:hypothetical protein [Bacteroidota bacterium]
MKQKITLLTIFFFLLINGVVGQQDSLRTNPKIYIAFLWHMHQPIYYPYENIVQTEQSGHYSFSLYDVHLSRNGPYTDWPKNAVQKGVNAGMDHFGAQVSFSGSLIENLNNLEQAGVGFSNWRNHWNTIINQTTTLGNPRIDMVGFGYHHPLMGLIHYKDIRKQIQDHKSIFSSHFSGSYSKGIFPPETAFSPRIIPALVDEGLEWVLVDNLHFERATANAPTGDASAVLRPNLADIRNPDPQDWLQLNGLWAPLPVSTQWAHQPHYVSYTDPETGEVTKIIAVPASRYLGQEDGRGGFGALNYDLVMSQFEGSNTDPDRPILIVLHHDGDNFGGGSESYYNNNFQSFVNWLNANDHRFECTTIQDYLERFPIPEEDVIHIQDGSWLGADGGDPEFKKWNGDPGNYPGASGAYSPDRNSWGIMTAAQNIVHTADQINPNDAGTQQGWQYYLNGQASDYWYWDGTEIWDSNPVRAANQAVNQALPIAQSGPDLTGPSVYAPQREPYNPGGIEWDGVGIMPSDFSVWTYVFDLNGLQSVNLKYRISVHETVQQVNLTYSGGGGVESWQTLPMSAQNITSVTDPLPLYKASEYAAEIVGLENVLVDYYVEAVDQNGNITKSPIQHVWVADGSGGGGSSAVSWQPTNPSLHDVITITATHANEQSMLHWGVNSWEEPLESYWPEGTIPHDVSDAVQSPPKGQNESGHYYWEIGPFNNSTQVVDQIAFVIKINESQWDNNNGNDYFIVIDNNPSPNPVSSDVTINLLQNESYTFSLFDFPFQSPSGSSFEAFQLQTLPAMGSLVYNGQPVVISTNYSNPNLLVFTPETNGLRTPYTSFQFKVKDQNGLYSEASYLLSINVNSGSPMGSNSSVSLMQNESYVFSEANFPFSSSAGNQFEGIRVQSLPENGLLVVNENSVIEDQLITNLTALVYTPNTGETGSPYADFSYYLVDDAGLESEQAYSLTMHVLNNFPAGVSWYPEEASTNDVLTIVVNDDAAMSNDARLHWGVNDWNLPNELYWPAGTQAWNDGLAVQSPLQQNGSAWTIQLGPFNQSAQSVSQLDFVIHYGGDSWNNNEGNDWHIPIIDYTDIRENKSDSDLIVFPNPAEYAALVSLPECANGKFKLSLRDLKANIIVETELMAGEQLELRKNRLPAGMYVLIAEGVDKIYTQKIVFK